MIDLIAVAVIAGYGWLGWQRGAARMGFSLGGFLAGYAAAIVLFRPVGALLSSLFRLGPILAYPLAGLLVMMTVSTLVRVRGARVRKAREERIERGWQPPRSDRVGGAALGSLTAAGVVLIAVWGFGALTDLRAEVEAAEKAPRAAATRSGALPEPTAGPAPSPSESRSHSFTERLSIAVAEKTAYAATRMAVGDPQLSEGVSAVISRPGQATDALRTLVGTERFGQWVNDDALAVAFLKGDPRAIAARPGVGRLVRDEEFLAAARLLRLVDPDEKDPEQLARQLAEQLAPIGGTVAALAGDREFMDAVARSGVGERIRKGQYLAVANDPKLTWMIKRVGAVLETQRLVTKARR